MQHCEETVLIKKKSGYHKHNLKLQEIKLKSCCTGMAFCQTPSGGVPV